MTDLKAYAEKAEALIQAKQYRQTHKREFVTEDYWYDWQKEGFAQPFEKKSVMTMAGNQTGKSLSAGYHTACDLTGDYPDWWPGFKFDHALDSTALGVDNTQLKDVIQDQLFGAVIEDERGRRFAGGWIHPDEIDGIEWSPQVKNLARMVTIKSRFGPSVVHLRASTQSKTGQSTLSFAGTVKDLIWVDECPPDELIGQLKVRTINGNQGKGGRVRYTMTPELGATKLVVGFTDKPGPSKHLVGPISWDECPHLTPEVQESILEDIPEHEHDMRKKGTPFFGSGLVYAISEDRIRIDPFEVWSKPWMRGLKAIDIGTTHPTAISWLAYDPEDDTVYLVKTYKQAGAAAAVHASAANAYWRHVPTVFPHDIDQTEPGSGKTAREWYEKGGLTHTLDFKNPDGSLYVEPGILDVLERMQTGRFKVFSTCDEFWKEFRMYHRKDGKIVKEMDDIMDTVRTGTVMAPNYAILLAHDRYRPPQVKGAVGRL